MTAGPAASSGERPPVEGKRTPSAGEHRTVARVVAMLEHVLASDAEGMRLGDLASAIDAPKSSVHGLAKGLVATGYFREAHGRYFAGPAISTLIAAGAGGLPSVYHHALSELASASHETAVLATLVGNSLVYLDSVHNDTLIRAAPPLNKRLPLWPRSSGKCFLAFMDPKRADAYLRRNHPEIKDLDQVHRDFEVTRRTHVAVNVGETIGDHIGIASPIDTGNAPVTVALAAIGPRSRMEDRIDEIAAIVRHAAEQLSRRAGSA